MSSATKPLGMNSMPSSGYNHKSTIYNKQYIPWKGIGLNSFPVGTAPGHIRPLTNNDPGNNFPTGFGLARPIKHYRKGRVIPAQPITGVPNLNGVNPNNGSIPISINENALINYNMNRFVKSSTSIPLGGSSSSSGLLNDMLGAPGSYLVKQNTCRETSNNNLLNNNNNWNQVYNDSQFITSIITQSSTGQYLISSNNNVNSIITSNDYGETWSSPITLLNLAGCYGMAISSSGQYQVVASAMFNTILYTYYSSDYGVTWNESFFDVTFSGGDLYTVKMSSDGQKILISCSQFMGTNSLLFISNDNGQTYSQLYDFSPHFPNVFFPDLGMSSDGKYITLIGIIGEILISNDYGVTFNNPTTPPTADSYFHLSISSDGKYQICCSHTNNNIYYSIDYGENWNTSIGLPTSLFRWFGLSMSGDGSLALAHGEDNVLNKIVFYISKDYGTSWNFLGIIPGSQSPFFASTSSISSDGNKIVFSNTDGIVGQIFTLTNLIQDCNANITENCKTCEGIGIVASYKPNTTFLEENPEPNTQTSVWCCNDEYKAKRRAIYASTNLKKNYYTSTKQYLQNRCNTYDQKVFNFLSYRTNTNGPYNDNNPYYTVRNSGPTAGSPETQTAAFLSSNLYFANCQPGSQIYDATQVALINQMINIMVQSSILTPENVIDFNATGINSIEGFYNWLNTLQEPQKTQAITLFTTFIRNPYYGMPLEGPSNPAGCQITVYKPNNYQYAKQGAVSSSTRLLKLNVNTISTNAASINNYNNTGPQLVSANQLYAGDNPNVMNLLKNKAPGCNTPWPLNFSQSGPFQNKKFCYYKKLPQYQNPVSQPSPYRYFPGTVFSSNHFSQSPNTYNTPSR
jgi:hypothetical protein